MSLIDRWRHNLWEILSRNVQSKQNIRTFVSFVSTVKFQYYNLSKLRQVRYGRKLAFLDGSKFQGDLTESDSGRRDECLLEI
jgi:hypothetical protein